MQLKRLPSLGLLVDFLAQRGYALLDGIVDDVGHSSLLLGMKRPGAVCLASGSRAEQRAKRLQKAAMQRGRNWERLTPVNSNE